MARNKPNLLILALLGIGGWFLWKRMQQAKVASQRVAIDTTGAQYVLPPDAT